jgi:hypothetical protein
MPIQRSTNLSIPQRRAPRLKLDYDVPYFGSLDTTSDPSLMAEEDSPDNLNVVYDTIRAVGSRKGYIKLLTTPTPSYIGGLYSLYQSTGTRQLVYASNRNLYKYDNAGGSTLLTGTPATFTADQQWSFDEYQDTVYGGNGVDGLIQYNGTTVSVANSGITPAFVKVHKNRVYCANKNSSTLYFSDAANPTSFPVNNFILINTNDGQNITGISEVLDNLIIFKDDSVWILTGEPLGAGNTTTIGDLQLRKANGVGGCSAFRTIAQVGQTLFFMHHTGIYALQNYTVSLISPLLSNTFKNGMNPNTVNLCWGLYSNQEKKYLLGYPSAGSNVCDSALVYDFLTKAYSHWDDLPGSCATSFKFSGTDETICMGDPVKGNIYELFQGYADIAGDNGTSTGGTNTTLVDTTKNWVTNQFVDCRVGTVSVNADGGTTINSLGTIISNTSNTLTFAATALPTNGQVYTIGYYTSYWKSKNFDFNMIGYIKKYRFLNLFVDSAQYNMQFGFSIDFVSLSFQKAFKLVSNAPVWGQFVWGNFFWGGITSEFGQANIGSTGRYIQIIFGNNLANQPWRAIHYSLSYKLKKQRPNIVTT